MGRGIWFMDVEVGGDVGLKSPFGRSLGGIHVVWVALIRWLGYRVGPEDLD